MKNCCLFSDQNNMSVLITGDSHCGALRRGQLKLESEGFDTGCLIRPLGAGGRMRTPFFEDRGKYVEIVEPTFAEGLSQFPSKNEKFEAVGFSAPLHTALVWRGKWDGQVPWFAIEKARERKLVSSNLFFEVVRRDAKDSLAFLKAVARTTQVFVIEPPAPFRHLPGLKYFGESSVLKMHQAHRDYVLAELAKMNIPVVGLDPEWMDDMGFMSPEFRSDDENDMHHGNAKFGELMMRKISAFVQQYR